MPSNLAWFFYIGFILVLVECKLLRSSVLYDSQGRLCGYLTNINKSMLRWGRGCFGLWFVLGLFIIIMHLFIYIRAQRY